MSSIKVNSQFAMVSKEEIQNITTLAQSCKKTLLDGSGKGNDFIGWLDYSLNITEELLSEIEAIAKEVRERASVLIVVGIGGSYLGAKSAIDSLSSTFANEIARKSGGLAVYFLGQNLSPVYINDLMKHIEGESIYVNVISKSGTTTEPAVGFRIIKEYMERTYGVEEASKRIIATTDAKRGALKTVSTQCNYRTFVIPDNVGGRFSVITPVGLLPIACAGVSIRDLNKGLVDGANRYRNDNYDENEAMQYAVLRNALYKKGKNVEILVNYEPRLNMIAEWWKQLYGESEGKENKGIYPSSLNFTTDLHSVGQYVQQGERIMFETILNILHDDAPMKMAANSEDLDGLNYLTEKTLYEINQTAMKATMMAHYQGGVPNIMLEIEKWDAYHLGLLYSFFMHAVAFGGYMLDVNPFDQPGVEDYKRNMFALLGKPGYEKYLEELNKLMNQ